MRIVGGKYRGRKLDTGPDQQIRPTSDRTREALFSILAHNADLGPVDDDRPGWPREARVLDACAGTGALGLEAWSRGAAAVAFIEKAPAHCRLIERNARGCGIERPAVFQRDATAPGKAPRAFDLLFTDPPYADGLVPEILAALSAQGWLAPGALAVAEIPARSDLLPPDGFTGLDERVYGAAKLVFLRHHGG